MQYAAWQPVSTSLTTQGTKAPYYGSIAVAAALGRRPATVISLPLPSSLDHSSAYAIYTSSGTRLTRRTSNPILFLPPFHLLHLRSSIPPFRP